METELTLDLQLAYAEKTAKELERKAKDLWRKKAEQNEARAVKAEAAYGREVLDHAATRELLSERETGLGFYQRIAESAGLAMSDRDDIAALYGRAL
jgi:hypothetical protein